MMISPQRPFGVTLLLWLVLSLSAWGVVRFLAALRWWDVLTEFGARLSPLYLSITGAGWSVVGGVLFWGIATRKAWARIGVIAVACAWQIQYWIERVFFQSEHANLPFSLIASALLLVAIFIVSFHSSTKKFLTKSESYG
jgi:hypothetical protein